MSEASVMKIPTDRQQQLAEAFKLYCDVVSPGQAITKTEFMWMFDFCQKRGLDLLAKDVHFVPRISDGKKTIVPQTSIDGYRKIAAASGEYDGHEVFWCGSDGKWVDVWLLDEPPAAAKVVAHRKGCHVAFPAVAKFSEYAQRKKDGGLTRAWQNMGALMIAKCAEALALRKAFPQQLGGVYTDDEMQQAENHAPIKAPEPKPTEELAPPSEDDEWRNRLFVALTGKGCQFEGDAKSAESWLKQEKGKQFKQLTASECEDILAEIGGLGEGQGELL